MYFKIAALVILTLVYLYQMFQNYLGMRSTNNPIPKNVSDIYDEETYKKWKAYHGEKYRLTDGIELLERAGIEVIFMSCDEMATDEKG